MADEKPPVAGENSPPAPPSDTSADLARKAAKSKREIDLEIKLAEQEDRSRETAAELKKTKFFLEQARKAPSARKPGKSLLDELNDFVFPPEPAAAAPPPGGEA